MRFTLHPLFRLAATQPQLLAEHAEAYAELLSAQFASAALAWRQRAIIAAAAFTLSVVSIILVGFSTMLWAVTPLGQIHQPMILFAIPLIPGLAAIICWLAVRSRRVNFAFDEIKEQVRSDLIMWREASPP